MLFYFVSFSTTQKIDMLKKLYGVLFFTTLYLGSFAQALKPSDADSKISFVIKNMGLSVDGTLKGLKGKMVFNPRNLKETIFDVTVDVSTINTGIKKRDAHLLTDDFFDAAKYPVIEIKSTSIVAKGNNAFAAKAILILHGVSKNIQFDFTAAPVTGGYNFKTEFTIDRRDYGVGGNSMTMGDNVTINLNVVGKH